MKLKRHLPLVGLCTMLTVACVTDELVVEYSEVAVMIDTTSELTASRPVSAMILDDGRVLFSDITERGVFRWDPQSGAIDTLAPIGDGPGEMRRPQQLSRLGPTTIAAFDAGLSRFSFFNESTFRIDSVRALPDALPGWQVIGGDAGGGVLFIEPPFAPVDAGEDSLRVVRWDVASGAIDSVARVLGPTQVVRGQQSKGTSSTQDRFFFPQPFSPQDLLDVDGEGRIWIARIGESVLVDLSVGRSSPQIVTESIRISAEDRAPFESQASQPDWDWPAVKPAFDGSRPLIVDGGLAAVPVFSSTGVPAYIAVDEMGGQFRFELSRGMRVLALDGDRLLIASLDDVGLTHLAFGRLSGERRP